MSSLVENVIRLNTPLLNGVSQKIWHNPELGFQEQYAHDVLTQTLEKLGFEVQRNYILHTGFRAKFSTGKGGPTVAFICEYDALPGIGHACGHNLIAELGLAAGIAVKEAMKVDATICGTVLVLGTPAEETGGGKITFIEKGAFKNVDAALMAHPSSRNSLFPLILNSLDIRVKYRMKGSMDPFENLNAVDAAVACYNNITIMRRTFETRWRVNVVLKKSSAEDSDLAFILRAPTLKELNIVREKVGLCVKTAGEVSNCEYEIEENSDKFQVYKGMIANKTMADVFANYATAKGIVFMKDISRVCETAVSTDMGNVSHVVPSIHPEYSINSEPHFNHTPGFADAAGASTAQHPTLMVAMSLAETALKLMSDAEFMTKVKEEFDNNMNKEI